MLEATLMTIRSIFCSNNGFLAVTVTACRSACFSSSLMNGSCTSFLLSYSNESVYTGLYPTPVDMTRYLPGGILANRNMPSLSVSDPLTNTESDELVNKTLALGIG